MTRHRDAPTRIAFCITELDPGGAEQALVDLATRLDRAEWEPHVISLAGRGEMADRLDDAEIPVVCLGAESVRDIGVVWRLRRELKRIRPAILQCFLHHANMAGRFAGRLAGVPRIVCGVRVAEKRSRRPLRMDRWTHRLVDRYVCVSRGVADFTIREAGIPAKKVLVIPNGVDVDAIRAANPADLGEFGIPPGAQTILFLGRLDPQKGPDVLIEAAAVLLERRPQTHVLLVGEGPMRGWLESAIHERNLGGRVHLAGRRRDVPGLLLAADVFALPSRWEGMPNALLEAMAAGLPVVATRVEGALEVVEDGRTGRLISADNPDELATAFLDYLESPSNSSQMGKSAQLLMEECFTHKGVVASYEELYRELRAE